MSEELYVVEPYTNEKAQIMPKNDGPPLIAPEDAGRAENCEQGTSKFKDREWRPTEFVVDPVITSIVDGQRTLYRERRYDHDSDDIWKPANHSSQQLIARHEKQLRKMWRKNKQ